jgi:hypothetical protein
MVPIPYAPSYYSAVKGSSPKLVCCEQCGFEYVYLVTATGRGEGTSFLFQNNEAAKHRARAAAEADLAAALAERFAVVPCRECGHIQQHMIVLARDQRHGGMGCLWVLLLLGGIALAALTLALSLDGYVEQPLLGVLWAVAALLAAFSVGLLVRWHRLYRRYDPNAEPVELRKQLGQKRATSKELFLQSIEEREEAVFCCEAAARSLWTVRDEGGFPLPAAPNGRRAQPFWSSRPRLEEATNLAPAFLGFTPVEISWDDFRDNWVPGLAGHGFLVGVNWSGEPVTGPVMEPEQLVRLVQAVINKAPQGD